MRINNIFLVFSALLITVASPEKAKSGRSLSRQKRLIFPQFTVYQVSLIRQKVMKANH